MGADEMNLALGVEDFPYKDGKSVSTGDVAEILERRYHVMEAFADMHKDEIAQAISHALMGALENRMMGAPLPENPYAQAEEDIKAAFRQFLDLEDMAGRFEGVPTEAALKGVNHRLKKKRGIRRPSFIDTGQYQASFTARIEP